jgi:hypothetical protein
VTGRSAEKITQKIKGRRADENALFDNEQADY